MSLSHTLNQPIGQVLTGLFGHRSATTKSTTTSPGSSPSASSRRPFPGGVVSQPAGPSPAGATTTLARTTTTPAGGGRPAETYVLRGVVDALTVYRLRVELGALTSQLAPKIVVDLREVGDLHPECISMLMLYAHRARQQAGSLVVLPPNDGTARNTLEHVGLVHAA